MVQHWHYNLSDIENMMAWERLFWIDLLQEYIEEKKQEEQNRR